MLRVNTSCACNPPGSNESDLHAGEIRVTFACLELRGISLPSGSVVWETIKRTSCEHPAIFPTKTQVRANSSGSGFRISVLKKLA